MHSLDLRYHVWMMRTIFRLLLWLSITVLSLQGGAAMAVGQPEQAVHETVVMTGHQHHRAAAQADGGHCTEADSKTVVSSHAKCAVCVSCCVGAGAPPGLLPTFHAPPFSSSLHALAEAAMTSFVPPALERPPRLDLV